jgi:hypothetical protein
VAAAERTTDYFIEGARVGDARGNVYPRKARPEQKIDATVALIMVLGHAIS